MSKLEADDRCVMCVFRQPTHWPSDRNGEFMILQMYWKASDL